MIVFDASTLVGVAIRLDSTPGRALQLALRTDLVAVSEPTLAELSDVLYRPRLARFVVPHQRSELLRQLVTLGVHHVPSICVTDCRDAKDNKYLELALASGATRLVSSDEDLLVLNPWRGLRIMRPATYLAEAGAG